MSALLTWRAASDVMLRSTLILSLGLGECRLMPLLSLQLLTASSARAELIDQSLWAVVVEVTLLL